MSYIYELIGHASVMDREREREEMAALKMGKKGHSLRASIAARLVRLAVLVEPEATLCWLSPEVARPFGADKE